MTRVLSSIIFLTATGILWSSGCASSETSNTGQTHPSDASADTSSPGSCDVNYCPDLGFGEPCCVAPNGACGHNMGQGCIQNDTTGNADGG